MNLILLFAFLSTTCVLSFKRSSFTRRKSITKLNALDVNSLLTSILLKSTPEQAKVEFYFFFFGGSGALGIGGAQVPKLLKEADYIKSLGGGSSLGGDDLSVSPIATFGYPEPLKIKDLEQVFQQCPSVEVLLTKGPKKTYLAQQGYVERGAFIECLPTCNPLAIYAVFEAISGGSGASVATPKDVREKLDFYKNTEFGLETFKNDLLSANLKKLSAYSVFGFLIALVLDLIIESGIAAFL